MSPHIAVSGIVLRNGGGGYPKNGKTGGGDGGVIQGGSGPGLGQKAVAEAGVGIGKLDGNAPAQKGIFGEVDDAHAALPEFVQNAVVRERTSQHQPSRRR